MRVLWLKYGQILPVDTGGKLRSLSLLQELQERVELTFVCYDRDLPAEYGPSISALLPGTHVYSVADIPSWRHTDLRSAVRSVAGHAPLHVTRFTSTEARNRLTELVERTQFDVGICDFLTPTGVFPSRLSKPTVLFEHNVEWSLWRRRTETVNGIRRAVYARETRLTRSYERRMLRRFDATVAVSAIDRDCLLQLEPTASIHVVPTGVDVAGLAPIESCPRAPRLVLFVGSLHWQPNVDGMHWFLDHVWPRVRVAVPDAIFRIADDALRPISSPRRRRHRDLGTCPRCVPICTRPRYRGSPASWRRDTPQDL